MAVGLVKPPAARPNDNLVNVDFAPTTAEADAILARFGYSEQVAIAA